MASKAGLAASRFAGEARPVYEDKHATDAEETGPLAEGEPDDDSMALALVRKPLATLSLLHPSPPAHAYIHNAWLSCFFWSYVLPIAPLRRAIC